MTHSAHRAAPARSRLRLVRRALLTALAFSALLAVSAIGLTGYEYHHLNSNITRVQVLQTSDTHIIDAAKQINAENYLLIGSDTRAGDDADGTNVAGARSDTTILIHLSPDRSQAIGISIPRDSWVDIPACKKSDGSIDPEHMEMFNSAFDEGGPACTIATVQKLTGIEVTHYVAIDFTGFKNMVDALGTVTVCSPEAVHDAYSGLRLVKGNNALNGTQALAYVRARETLGDGSDLGRIKRQQRFLGTVLRQALSGNLLSNPIALNNFLDAATKAITVDQATSLGDLRTLMTALQGLDPAHVTFFTAPIANQNYTPPGTHETGRVLLDSVAGAVLYGDVINDATQTINTQTTVTDTGSTTVTVAPSAPSTTTTPAASLPAGGISGADTSCTL